MQKYLNTGIKDVIMGFPQVGELLNQNGIGCVTCSVGTCLLKDIIEVHNLSREQEAEIMARIEKAIYPDRDVKIKAASDFTADVRKLKYSPPVKELVEEHVRIKNLLALIPDICSSLEAGQEMDRTLISGIVDFIRNYADRFHHAKEEDILFKYADESQQMIQVMYEDHKTGRGFVKAVVEGAEKNDPAQVIYNLTAYRELLTQHIKKEDEILYPWIDRSLTTRQVGELTSRFNEVNEGFDADYAEKYDRFIASIKKV